jgi:hypothetical protein
MKTKVLEENLDLLTLREELRTLNKELGHADAPIARVVDEPG